MKKFRVALPLLAFLLAIALSSFTAKSHSHPATTDQVYSWYRASDLQFMDKDIVGDANSGEIQTSGCNGASTPCEYGFLDSQLVDPNNPSAGVKSGETPSITIFEHQ
jgi:hypothetical protein